MAQEMCGDPQVANLKTALHQVVVADRRGELLESDREVGVVHLSGQDVLQTLPRPTRCVHVPFAVGHEQRPEKWQALDMVPMGVGDEQVAPQWALPGGQQGLAEVVNASSAIQDDERRVGGADLNAGSVTAVAQ